MGIIKTLKNRIKGTYGESRLEKSLNLLDFFGYKGYCLRNVYVPKKDGSTSEIDVLYITAKGLFVIESKNYSGYIFGNESNSFWTSTLYAGKNWLGFKKVQKNRFYNPIWQNNGHISALRNYCGDVKAFSIIAFGNNCRFKDVTWTSDNVTVCYYSELKKIVRKIWNNNPEIYDQQDMDRIYHDLASLDSSSETKKRHISSLSTDHPICPECGNPLVLRTAKNGPYAGNGFYGCSNYPRCKYIKNI